MFNLSFLKAPASFRRHKCANTMSLFGPSSKVQLICHVGFADVVVLCVVSKWRAQNNSIYFCFADKEVQNNTLVFFLCFPINKICVMVT